MGEGQAIQVEQHIKTGWKADSRTKRTELNVRKAEI